MHITIEKSCRNLFSLSICHFLNFWRQRIFTALWAFSIGWHFLVRSALCSIFSHYGQHESVVLGYIEICILRWKKLQKSFFFVNMSFSKLLTSKNFYGTLSVFNRLALFSKISSLLNLFTLWAAWIRGSGAYWVLRIAIAEVTEIHFLWQCAIS